MAIKEHPLLSPKNFWPASSYLVLLGILAAVVVELNKEHQWLSLEWLGALLLMIAILGGMQLHRRLRAVFSSQVGRYEVVEKEHSVRGAEALIDFVSQGEGRSSAYQAAQYHAQCKALKHLWLVTTRAAEQDANWVKQEVEATLGGVIVHEVHFLEMKDEINEAKEVVEHLRRLAMNSCRAAEKSVMCDFTGLTKNASAGMVLACAAKEARLQYMVPNELLEDGRADPSKGSRPREVDIRYMVVLQEDE